MLPDHPKEVFKHPVVAPGLKGKVIVRIVSGGDHAMALDEDGKLYTWGCYEQGRLGRIPEKFSHRCELADSWSPMHPTLALWLACSQDRQPFGQPGLRLQNHRLTQAPLAALCRDLHKKCLTPAVVTIGKLRGASANRIVDIAAGSFHSFAITENKKKADLVKVCGGTETLGT